MIGGLTTFATMSYIVFVQPTIMSIAGMPFGYGITEGVAMGCISFVLVKTLSGRANEVNPIMYAVALALIGRYAFLR